MPNEHAELITMLTELLERSNNLRTALMKRDLDGIWSASGAQEALLGRLQNMHGFNSPAPSGKQASGKTESVQQEKVGTLVSRIRTVQRTNKAMSSAFLTIINRTFASLCSGGNNVAGTYSASGSRDINISSILVQQQG